jgi:hypothetical protein
LPWSLWLVGEKPIRWIGVPDSIEDIDDRILELKQLFPEAQIEAVRRE